MDGSHAQSLAADLVTVAPFLPIFSNQSHLEMPAFDGGVASCAATISIHDDVPPWDAFQLQESQRFHIVSKVADDLQPWAISSFFDSPNLMTTDDAAVPKKDVHTLPGSVSINLKPKDFRLLTGIDCEGDFKLKERVSPASHRTAKMLQDGIVCGSELLDQGANEEDILRSDVASISGRVHSESGSSIGHGDSRESTSAGILEDSTFSFVKVVDAHLDAEEVTDPDLDSANTEDPSIREGAKTTQKNVESMASASVGSVSSDAIFCGTALVASSPVHDLPADVARFGHVKADKPVLSTRPRTQASVLAWTQAAKSEASKKSHKRSRIKRIARPKILQRLKQLGALDGGPSDRTCVGALVEDSLFAESLPILMEAAKNSPTAGVPVSKESRISLQGSSPFVLVAQSLAAANVHRVGAVELPKTFMIQPMELDQYGATSSPKSAVTAHIHYPGCPWQQQAFDDVDSESVSRENWSEYVSTSPNSMQFNLANRVEDSSCSGIAAGASIGSVVRGKKELLHDELETGRMLLDAVDPDSLSSLASRADCTSTVASKYVPGRNWVADASSGLECDLAKSYVKDSNGESPVKVKSSLSSATSPIWKFSRASSSVSGSTGISFTRKSNMLESPCPQVQVASLKDVLFRSARPRSPPSAFQSAPDTIKDKATNSKSIAKETPRRLSDTALLASDSRILGTQLRTQLSAPDNQKAQIMETSLTLQSHLGAATVSETPASSSSALLSGARFYENSATKSGATVLSSPRTIEQVKHPPIPQCGALGEQSISTPVKKVVKAEPRDDARVDTENLLDPSVFSFSLSVEAENAARAAYAETASVAQPAELLTEARIVSVKQEPVDYTSGYEVMYENYGYVPYVEDASQDLFRHEMVLRGYQQCLVCQGYFPDRAALSAHMKKCGVHRFYYCPHCDASFEKKRLLRQHKAKHHRSDASDSGATSEDMSTPHSFQTDVTYQDADHLDKTVAKKSTRKPQKKGLLSKQPKKVARKNMKRRYQAFIDQPSSKVENRQRKGGVERPLYVCDLCEISPFASLGALKNHLRSFHHLTSGQVDLLLKFQGYDKVQDVERAPCRVKEEPPNEMTATDANRRAVQTFNIGLSDVLSDSGLISNVSVRDLSSPSTRGGRRVQKKSKNSRSFAPADSSLLLARGARKTTNPSAAVEEIVSSVLRSVVDQVVKMDETCPFSPAASYSTSLSQQASLTYRYNCRLCGKAFQLAFAYVRHLRAKHNLTHIEAKKVIRYQRYVRSGPLNCPQPIGDGKVDKQLRRFGFKSAGLQSRKGASRSGKGRQLVDKTSSSMDSSRKDVRHSGRKQYPKRRHACCGDVPVNDPSGDHSIKNSPPLPSSDVTRRQTSRKSSSGRKSLKVKNATGCEFDDNASPVGKPTHANAHGVDSQSLFTRAIRKKKALCSCCEYDGEEGSQSMRKLHQKASKGQLGKLTHDPDELSEAYGKLPENLILSADDGKVIQSFLDAKLESSLEGHSKASLPDIYAALLELSQKKVADLQVGQPCSDTVTGQFEEEDDLVDLFVSNVILKARFDLERENFEASTGMLLSKAVAGFCKGALDEDMGFTMPAEVLRKSYRCFLCWQNFKGYHPYSSHLQGVHKLSKDFVRNILNPDQSKVGEAVAQDAIKDKQTIDKLKDFRIYRTVEITCQICKKSLPSVYALDKHFRVAHGNVRLNQDSTVLVINKRRPSSASPTTDAPNVKLLSDVCGTIPHLSSDASLQMDVMLEQQSDFSQAKCSSAYDASASQEISVSEEVLEPFDTEVSSVRSNAGLKTWFDQDMVGSALVGNLNFDALLRSLDVGSGGSSFVESGADIGQQTPLTIDHTALDAGNNPNADASTRVTAPDNFTNIRVDCGSSDGDNFVNIHSLAAKYGIIADMSLGIRSTSRTDNQSACEALSKGPKAKLAKKVKAPKKERERGAKPRKLKGNGSTMNVAPDSCSSSFEPTAAVTGKSRGLQRNNFYEKADFGSSLLTTKSVSQMFDQLSQSKLRDSVDFKLPSSYTSPVKQRFSCYKCSREFRLASAYRQHLILRHRLHDEDAARIVRSDPDVSSLPGLTNTAGMKDAGKPASKKRHDTGRILKSNLGGKKVIVSAVKRGKMKFLPRLPKGKSSKGVSSVLEHALPPHEKVKKTSPNKTIETPSQPEIRCQICDESFPSIYALDKHFRFLHDDSTDDDLGCQFGLPAPPRRTTSFGQGGLVDKAISDAKSLGVPTLPSISAGKLTDNPPVKLSEDEVAWYKINGRKRRGKQTPNMRKIPGSQELVRRRDLTVEFASITDEDGRDADEETSETEMDVAEVVHSVMNMLLDEIACHGNRPRHGWQAPLGSAEDGARLFSSPARGSGAGGHSSDSALSSIGDPSPTKSLSVFVKRMPATSGVTSEDRLRPSEQGASPSMGGSVDQNSAAPRVARKSAKSRKKKSVSERDSDTVDGGDGVATEEYAAVDCNQALEGGDHKCCICLLKVNFHGAYVKHLRSVHGLSEADALLLYQRGIDTPVAVGTGVGETVSSLDPEDLSRTPGKKKGRPSQSSRKRSSDSSDKSAPDISCSICQKPFASVYALDKHFRLVHEAPAVEGDSSMLVLDPETSDCVWNSKLVFKKKPAQSGHGSGVSKSRGTSGTMLFGANLVPTPAVKTVRDSNGLLANNGTESTSNGLEEKAAVSSSGEPEDLFGKMAGFFATVDKSCPELIDATACDTCRMLVSPNALDQHVCSFHEPEFNDEARPLSAPVLNSLPELACKEHGSDAHQTTVPASTDSARLQRVHTKGKGRGRKMHWRRRLKLIKLHVQKQLQKDIGPIAEHGSEIGIVPEQAPAQKMHWRQRLKQSLKDISGVVRGVGSENPSLIAKPVHTDLLVTGGTSTSESHAVLHEEIQVSFRPESMKTDGEVGDKSFNNGSSAQDLIDESTTLLKDRLNSVENLELSRVADTKELSLDGLDKLEHVSVAKSALPESTISAPSALFTEMDWPSFAQEISCGNKFEAESGNFVEARKLSWKTPLISSSPSACPAGTHDNPSDSTGSASEHEASRDDMSDGVPMSTDGECGEMKDFKVMVSPLATKLDLSVYLEKLSSEPCCADVSMSKRSGTKFPEQYRSQCDSCKISFSTTFALNQHNRKVHSSVNLTADHVSSPVDGTACASQGSDFTCIIRGKELPSLCALDRHLRLSHDDPNGPSTGKNSDGACFDVGTEAGGMLSASGAGPAKEVSPETYYELFSDSDSGSGGTSKAPEVDACDSEFVEQRGGTSSLPKRDRPFGEGRTRKSKLSDLERMSEGSALADKDFFKVSKFDPADESAELATNSTHSGHLYELATAAALKASETTATRPGIAVSSLTAPEETEMPVAAPVPVEQVPGYAGASAKPSATSLDRAVLSTVRSGDACDASLANADRSKKAGILKIAMKIGKSLLGKSGPSASQALSPNSASADAVVAKYPRSNPEVSATDHSHVADHPHASCEALPSRLGDPAPCTSLELDTPLLVDSEVGINSNDSQGRDGEVPQVSVLSGTLFSQTTPSSSASECLVSGNLSLLATAARTHTAVAAPLVAVGASKDDGRKLEAIVPDEHVGSVSTLGNVMSPSPSETITGHEGPRALPGTNNTAGAVSPDADVIESDVESDEQLVEVLVGVESATILALAQPPEQILSPRRECRPVELPQPSCVSVDESRVAPSKVALAFLEDRSRQIDVEPRKAIEAVLNSASEMHNRKERVGLWVESTAALATTLDSDLPINVIDNAEVVMGSSTASLTSTKFESGNGRKKPRKSERSLEIEEKKAVNKQDASASKAAKPARASKQPAALVPEKYLETFFMLEGQDKIDYGAYLNDVFGIDADLLLRERRQRSSQDVEPRMRDHDSANRREDGGSQKLRTTGTLEEEKEIADRTDGKIKTKKDVAQVAIPDKNAERNKKARKRSKRTARTEPEAVDASADANPYRDHNIAPERGSLMPHKDSAPTKPDVQYDAWDQKGSKEIAFGQPKLSSLDTSGASSKVEEAAASRKLPTSRKQSSWDVGPSWNHNVPPVQESYDVDPRAVPDYAVGDYNDDFLPELEAVPDEGLLDPARLAEPHNAFAVSSGGFYGFYDASGVDRSANSSSAWGRGSTFDGHINQRSLDGKGTFRPAFSQLESGKRVEDSGALSSFLGSRPDHFAERRQDSMAQRSSRLDRLDVSRGSRGRRSRSSSSSSSSSSDSSSSGELSTTTSEDARSRAGSVKMRSFHHLPGSVSPKSRGSSFERPSVDSFYQHQSALDKRSGRGLSDERGVISDRFRSDRQSSSGNWNHPAERESYPGHATNQNRDALLKGFFIGGSCNPQVLSRFETPDLNSTDNRATAERDFDRSMSREALEWGKATDDRTSSWDSYGYGEEPFPTRKWTGAYEVEENQAVLHDRDQQVGPDYFAFHRNADFHARGSRKRDGRELSPRQAGSFLDDKSDESDAKKARKSFSRWDVEPDAGSSHDSYRSSREDTQQSSQMFSGGHGTSLSGPAVSTVFSYSDARANSARLSSGSSSLPAASSVPFPFDTLKQLIQAAERGSTSAPQVSAPNQSSLPVSASGFNYPPRDSSGVVPSMQSPATAQVRPPIFSVPPPPIPVPGLPPPPFLHMRGIPPPMAPIPGVPPPILTGQPVLMMAPDPSVRPPNMPFVPGYPPPERPVQNASPMQPSTMVPLPISRPYLPPHILPPQMAPVRNISPGVLPTHMALPGGPGIAPSQYPPGHVVLPAYPPGQEFRPPVPMIRAQMPLTQQQVPTVSSGQEFSHLLRLPHRLPHGPPVRESASSLTPSPSATPAEQYPRYAQDYRFVSSISHFSAPSSTPGQEVSPIPTSSVTSRVVQPSTSDPAPAHSAVVSSTVRNHGSTYMSGTSAGTPSSSHEIGLNVGSGEASGEAKPAIPGSLNAFRAVSPSNVGVSPSQEAGMRGVALQESYAKSSTEDASRTSVSEVLSRDSHEARPHHASLRDVGSTSIRQRPPFGDEFRPRGPPSQGQRLPGPPGQEFRQRGPASYGYRPRGPADHSARPEGYQDYQYDYHAVSDQRLRGPFNQDFRPFGLRGQNFRQRGPVGVDMYVRGPPPRHELRLRTSRPDMRMRGPANFDFRTRGPLYVNYRQPGAPRAPYRPRFPPGGEQGPRAQQALRGDTNSRDSADHTPLSSEEKSVHTDQNIAPSNAGNDAASTCEGTDADQSTAKL